MRPGGEYSRAPWSTGQLRRRLRLLRTKGRLQASAPRKQVALIRL